MGPLQKYLGISAQRPLRIMAISNELSSEIAAALLTHKGSPQDLLKLKDVLLEIHLALQKMSEQEHPSRLRAATLNFKLPSDSRAH